MSSVNIERHNQLITKYCIPNMGSYSAVGGELSPILERLDTNRALSAEDKQWIRDKGLFDLNEFIKKLELTGQADFRILRTKIEKQQKKNTRQALWEKYEIDYIESHEMHRMVKTLLKLEEGNRLEEQDILWLSTNRYFSEYPMIKQIFHKNEALFYRQCFEKNGDPWQAVNASSHYRKASLSTEALKILSKVDVTSQRNKHLRSALCTTKGGCKRDLHQFDDAIQLAETAHFFDSDSFHPCTLLGAVYYEIGNYGLGDEWFAKAEERGATIDNVDNELRYIFNRADKTKQEELKRHLLSVDSARYSWVNNERGQGRIKCKSIAQLCAPRDAAR